MLKSVKTSLDGVAVKAGRLSGRSLSSILEVVVAKRLMISYHDPEKCCIICCTLTFDFTCLLNNTYKRPLNYLFPNCISYHNLNPERARILTSEESVDMCLIQIISILP